MAIEERLADFLLHMKLSDYNENYKHSIIKSSITGFKRQTEQGSNGNRPMYKERSWNRIENRREIERKAAHRF